MVVPATGEEKREIERELQVEYLDDLQGYRNDMSKFPLLSSVDPNQLKEIEQNVKLALNANDQFFLKGENYSLLG